MIRSLITLCARAIVISNVAIDAAVATADAIEIINDFTIEYDKMLLARDFNLRLMYSSDEPSDHSETCVCDDCGDEPTPVLTVVRREIKDKRRMRFLHHVVMDRSDAVARQNILELYDLTSLCYSRSEIVERKTKILQKIRDYEIAQDYLSVDRASLF